MPSLEARLREEILRSGPISFARFMRLALYCPVLGYYEAHDRTIGRSGDFFTSVSVGGVFGQILGARFATWLRSIQPGPFHLVECGAHDGRLALDLLSWLRVREPELCPSLTLWIVEPSAAREQRQRERLGGFSSQVRWVARLEDLPPIHGIFFSNELLDAFPIHPLCWCAESRRWQERGVGWDPRAGRFVWEVLSAPEIDVQAEFAASGLLFPEELQRVLPDGFVVELCPEALRWWRQAARKLDCGWLMAIDYGSTAMELIRPERPHGTLRAYREHRLSPDVLSDPGSQDLTAHVNFSAVTAAGEAEGLVTAGLWRQGECLARWVTEAMACGHFVEWSAAERRQFQTLVHPEHLGHAFRILVQSRNIH